MNETDIVFMGVMFMVVAIALTMIDIKVSAIHKHLGLDKPKDGK